MDATAQVVTAAHAAIVEDDRRVIVALALHLLPTIITLTTTIIIIITTIITNGELELALQPAKIIDSKFKLLLFICLFNPIKMSL